MRNTFSRLLSAGVLVLLLPVLSSAIPLMISYQGKLTDSAGNPVTGSRSIVFNMYSTVSGGASLWNETQTVTVTGGVFDVSLGSVTPVPSSVFATDTAYLGIKVGTDAEMAPRQRIVSVGYAYRAGYAGSAGSADNAGYAGSAGYASDAGKGEAPFRVVRTSASNAPDISTDVNHNVIFSNMSGVGTAGYFKINNASNSSEALYAETNGTGAALCAVNTGAVFPAGIFVNTNSSNPSCALVARATGGDAGEFYMINPSSNAAALYATSSGSGQTITAKMLGTGEAGSFEIFNPSNTTNALYASTDGTGDALHAINNGTGRAGYFGGNVYISGSLTKASGSFVQPHTTDPSKEVVYAFFEGPEHAVFLRGTARLVDGGAVIETPDYFRIVAGNEGISVQLTPRSADTYGLAAVEVTKDRITVRELKGGTGGFEFDYFITAKREGFEAHQPIQANTHFSADGMTKEDFEKKYSNTDLTTTAMRNMLISNGILNADGTLNMDTVQRLGWKLKDSTPAGN